MLWLEINYSFLSLFFYYYKNTKLTITYLEASKAFRSFPNTTATCVTLAEDTNAETGCNQCTPHSLAKTLNSTSDVLGQINSGSVCKLTNSLTTVYCSQVDGGNNPRVSFSCYQGRFSAETPLQPTVIKKKKKHFIICPLLC